MTGTPMAKLLSYLKVGVATTADIMVSALTSGRVLLLEGRVQGGVFHNWALRFRYTPRQFARPTSEAEIVDLVREAKSLRVFGSAHSFNDGVVTDGVLVSLDSYAGLISVDPAAQQITVKAGTRVRDVVKLLANEGLAFKALPSHDAQSMGGILSTDVHGTGKGWGFISESVVGMSIVDGTGTVHRCGPSDDLFRAAVGGVGAPGIITEVVIQGVPRFNVDQKTEIQDLGWVRDHLDELLDANDHLSLYVFPFADTCQVNTWNRTSEAATPGGGLREFLKISVDALLAAWVGNFLAYAKLLPLSRHWSRLAYLVQRGSDLVLESDQAYNRTIYHLHQELEFTVPFEQTMEACDRLRGLYEQLYGRGLPYALLEVRFTPENHDATLLGAGRGRHSTWIDLVCDDSDGFEIYYGAAIEVIKEIGGRPHLGKYCDGFDHDDLERVHGDNYRHFLRVVAEHDPEGKFANAFTRRLFGTVV